MQGQDPNHMLTVGEEGFFGPLSSPRSWTLHNPNDRHWKKVSNMYKRVRCSWPLPLAAAVAAVHAAACH